MANFREFIGQSFPNGNFISDKVDSGGYQYDGYRFSSPIKVQLNPSAENTIGSELLNLYIFPSDNDKSFLVLLETSDSSSVKFEGNLSEIKMKEFIVIFSKLFSAKSYIKETTLSQLGVKRLETTFTDNSNLPVQSSIKTLSEVSDNEINEARKNAEECTAVAGILEINDVFDFFDFAQDKYEGDEEKRTYSKQDYKDAFGSYLVAIGAICAAISEKGTSSRLKQALTLVVQTLAEVEI